MVAASSWTARWRLASMAPNRSCNSPREKTWGGAGSGRHGSFSGAGSGERAAWPRLIARRQNPASVPYLPARSG